MGKGLLAGYRVLDLSRVLTGPYCSMILGDLGADVIKVELPGRGDDTRGWGPPYVGGESYYFLGVNRNKRSVTLNLKDPAGREVLSRLIQRSDVLLENFRPGAMDRMGFGYEAVHRLNPGLVYCSISGYGQTGPQSQRPGYDFILQGEGGMMSLTGEEGRPPVRIGVPLVDLGAGMWGVIGILSALLEAKSSGEGRHVDTSLLEASVSSLSYVASLFFTTGEIPRKAGAGHLVLVPYQAFDTQTQPIIVCVGNEAMWQRFCLALDVPELGQDPRYASNANRLANREQLVALLQDRFNQAPAEVWLRTLDAQGVPAGPIRNLEEVFADDQVQARDLVWEVDHPTAGAVKTLGFPVKFSHGGLNAPAPSPLLGEHNVEVLSELGYTQQEIQELQDSGVL